MFHFPGMRELRRMNEQKKILIVRLGAIGDVVRTLPSLHLLRRRFPEARIAWAVEEKAAEILEGHPGLDEMILVPRKKWSFLLKNPFTIPKALAEIGKFLQSIREKKFDTVLDFHSSIKSGIISLATGADERIGYTARHSREMNFLFNNVRIPLRQKRISRMERNLTLLKHFGIEPDEIKADIAISGDDRNYIDDHLKRERLDDKKKAIIFPGASRRQTYKKWGAKNYAALAEMLISKTDFYAILAWGPGELEECKEIASMVNSKVHISPGTTLKQLAELIRRCDLFIGGDTGAMHISCAMGTPCLVVYGPTDPVINSPWGKKYRIVYDEADCSPCRKRRCRKGKCFENLTPERVYAEVESFIGHHEF